jgi:hypothetical protein
LLIVLYSALLLALLGAGALVCRPLARGGAPRWFTSLAAGMSCLHLLTLVGLPIVFILGLLFAMAAGQGLLLWRARRTPSRWSAADVRWMGILLASVLPLWAYFMFRPLWAFDARNVWFFAGRIIFTSGRFPVEVFHRLMCHWGPDYRLNMNADYPKLIGALTAAVATLAGYWNEYLPKIGILLLHTLWLLGLFELGWRWRALAVNLLITGSTQYRGFFDSASLDLHVALLTMVAMLSLLRGGDQASQEAGDERGADVAMGVAALAVGSQLKYEGRALTVIVLVAALLSRAVTLRALRRAAPFALLFLPTALWLVEVKVFAVPSYLQYSRGLPMALQRMRTELWTTILPGIARQRATIGGVVSILVALVLGTRAARPISLAAAARSSAVRFGVLTALAYTAALVAVYLVSPYTTAWQQMETSVDRATLPIEVALLASAVALVERLGWARAKPAQAAGGETSPISRPA